MSVNNVPQFFYGVGPGRPNEHAMTAIGATWKEASVKGHLKQQGWGAEMGYPGIAFLDDASDEINGYIFCSDNFDKHWKEPDDFESEEYQRVLTKVKTKDNLMVEAYIYILRNKKP